MMEAGEKEGDFQTVNAGLLDKMFQVEVLVLSAPAVWVLVFQLHHEHVAAAMDLMFGNDFFDLGEVTVGVAVALFAAARRRAWSLVRLTTTKRSACDDDGDLAMATGTAQMLRATRAAVRKVTAMRLFLDTLAPMSHGTSEQHQQLLVCRTNATRLGSTCRSGTGEGTHCMESVASRRTLELDLATRIPC